MRMLTLKCAHRSTVKGKNQKREGLLKQGVIETHYTHAFIKFKQYKEFSTC